MKIDLKDEEAIMNKIQKELIKFMEFIDNQGLSPPLIDAAKMTCCNLIILEMSQVDKSKLKYLLAQLELVSYEALSKIEKDCKK